MKFGIGQPVRRKEDDRLLKGAGRYVDDIRLPGQAHGHVLRSPTAHARLTSLSLDAARALPGVLLVWSWDDVSDRLAPLGNAFPLKQVDGSDPAPVTMPHLSDGMLRFVGQPIAFIVAETRDIARDAAELIEFDFEELPVVVDARAALAPGAPVLHDEAPGNLAYLWTVGDAEATDAAFARAHETVTVDVVNQRIVVNPMEPRAVNARWDVETGRWDIWAATQGSHSLRGKLSGQLRAPPETIRVRTPDVGGGFGMKLQAHPEDALAALAARTLERPVKWTADRSESFLSDAQGRDLTTTAQGAFDADGRILAMRCRSVSNLGAYYSSVGVGVHTVFSAPLTGGMYDMPCFHHEVRGAFTNTTPTDAYRGAGRPEAIHVTEAVIDAGARAFGADPAEFRRRNLVTADQTPYRSHGGFVFDSLDTEAALDKALAASDHAGFPARRAAAAARGRAAGIAAIYYFERTGGAPLERAMLRVLPEGRVEAAVGTQSNGQGHETAWAQIIREKLGIPIESISLLGGDSDLLPAGGGTGGSRSLIMASRVFLKAADDVIEKATEAASELLEAAPGDLEFSAEDGGIFRIKGTDRSVTLFEAAEETQGITGLGEVNDAQSTFPNGSHVAEVEIDPETGRLDLVRYVIVDDFGTVINPLIVEGQVHGGVAQGAGQVMGERAIYDPQTGQPLTGSLMDYWMPRAADLPMFEFSMSPTPAQTNPLGVKGCGEAGSVGSIPAIALAVQDALRAAGGEVIAPPYPPHRLWEALRARRD